MGRGKNQQLAAISWVIYLILGSLVELGIAQEANQQPPQPVILQSNELNESSGVAQVGELLWTHSDSGDRPRLFAFATDGSLRGQFNIRGARAARLGRYLCI
ncbi:MAG: hypothetical protein R3C56_08420 [Pirellulaceae bacterium]